MNSINKVTKILDNLISGLPALEDCRYSIETAFQILKKTYDGGGKLLVCGNGGSAADSEHIVGELMKGFKCRRCLPVDIAKSITEAFPEEGEYLAANLQGALPAISLVSNIPLMLAFINDVKPDMVFAQQVYGYGRPGDTLIGLSTSGTSANVVNAFKIAKVFGLNIIGFTGSDGGMMRKLCNNTGGEEKNSTVCQDTMIMVPAV